MSSSVALRRFTLQRRRPLQRRLSLLWQVLRMTMHCLLTLLTTLLEPRLSSCTCLFRSSSFVASQTIYFGFALGSLGVGEVILLGSIPRPNAKGHGKIVRASAHNLSSSFSFVRGLVDALPPLHNIPCKCSSSGPLGGHGSTFHQTL